MSIFQPAGFFETLHIDYGLQHQEGSMTGPAQLLTWGTQGCSAPGLQEL